MANFDKLGRLQTQIEIRHRREEQEQKMASKDKEKHEHEGEHTEWVDLSKATRYTHTYVCNFGNPIREMLQDRESPINIPPDVLERCTLIEKMQIHQSTVWLDFKRVDGKVVWHVPESVDGKRHYVLDMEHYENIVKQLQFEGTFELALAFCRLHRIVPYDDYPPTVSADVDFTFVLPTEPGVPPPAPGCASSSSQDPHAARKAKKRESLPRRILRRLSRRGG